MGTTVYPSGLIIVLFVRRSDDDEISGAETPEKLSKES